MIIIYWNQESYDYNFFKILPKEKYTNLESKTMKNPICLDYV